MVLRGHGDSVWGRCSLWAWALDPRRPESEQRKSWGPGYFGIPHWRQSLHRLKARKWVYHFVNDAFQFRKWVAFLQLKEKHSLIRYSHHVIIIKTIKIAPSGLLLTRHGKPIAVPQTSSFKDWRWPYSRELSILSSLELVNFILIGQLTCELSTGSKMRRGGQGFIYRNLSSLLSIRKINTTHLTLKICF